jgi:serine/threonine protein phosphatase PrpC
MRAYRCYIEERMKHEREKRQHEMNGSTTLSVVRFHLGCDSCARAEYLAIGDSPIILAYRGDLAEGLKNTFLTQQIYGKLMQYENPGRIYSGIDLGEGKVFGRVAIGSFELEAGDVCMVATDGIPVRRFILNDLDERGQCHRFFNTIFSKSVEMAGRELFERIMAADGFGDDATLVAVVVGSGVSTHGGVKRESGVEERLARRRFFGRHRARRKRARS